MHRFAGLLIALVLPAPAAAAPLDAGDRLTLAGLGPIEYGMTVAQAERAAGLELVQMGIGGDCRYVRPEDERLRMSFMVRKDRIVRADLGQRGIRALGGVRVGDTEAEARRRLQGERVGPTKYLIGGHDLDVRGTGALRNRLLRVTTDGRRRVVSIQAGRLPEAAWVEQCG